MSKKTSFIISILVFILGYFLLSLKKTKPNEIEITIEAKVLENDNFQVFYSESQNYNQEQSNRVDIVRANDFQKINFKIPLQNIENLRLDVGINKSQKEIVLKSITLKTDTDDVIYKGSDISTYFSPNKFININKGILSLNEVANVYDPYLISTELVKADIAKISQIKNYISPLIAVVISFSIALSIFFFCLKGITHSVTYQPSQIIFITTFLMVLFLPLIVKTLDVNPKTDFVEKRELSVFPDFEFSKVYTKKFEAYYNDNFGLRNFFVKYSGLTKIHLFKTSPAPDRAIFGKDHHMFSGRAYVLNPKLFSDSDLKYKCESIIARKIKLNKQNITYIAGFWPNKHSIYPELLPSNVYVSFKDKKAISDQMVEYFKDKDFNFFDVRADLKAKKNDYDLYQKLDGHWNEYGAYFAYRSFCKQTKKELQLTAFDLDKFNVEENTIYGGDLTNIIGVNRIDGYSDILPKFSLKNPSEGFKYLDTNGFPPQTVRTKNTNCSNKLKVLVFRDSYTINLVQFLSLHFYEVTYIWKTYDESYVNKLNPNIVISGKLEGSVKYI
jgi:hypothetical protein